MDPRSEIWKPLDATKKQIRLFILAPSKDKASDLKGRLITVSLEQQLHYNAISHAWGGPSRPEVVIVNGVDWLVTKSLFDAFTQLRHRDQERCFWVDCLCINQFDVQERSRQVNLMEHIFNRAIIVQVWLGQGDFRIDNLMERINKESRLIKIFDPSLSDTDYNYQEETLATLSRLEYFERLWIIQEVALARDLRFMYDEQSFTEKKLKTVCKRYDDSFPRARDPNYSSIMHRLFPIVRARDLLVVATTGSVNHKVRKLLGMMQKSRSFKCTDPRDRIYGMLGIMTAMFGPGFLVPQYSLSVADVYTEFAGKLISTTGSLLLLNQAESIYNSSILSLPSWVPDWSSNFDHYDAAWRLSTQCDFRACDGISRSQSLTLATSPSLRVLIASGIFFDVVQKVGRCARSFSPYSARTRGIRGSLEGWRNMFPGPSINFAAIVTMDQIRPEPTLTECYEAVDTLSSKPSRRICNIQDILTPTVSNKCFFTTTSGRAGLGPRDTKPGDQLAILAGGNVPYVLRARSDAEDPYIFIGESYVRGVMHGEAVKEAIIHLREIRLK